MSDLELYNGLKGGDRKAIVLIYESLLPRVIIWIKQNSGTEADAHDVFQETLETILLKVDEVHTSFEGLVLKMSKHKWIDKLRKQKTSDKTKDAVSILAKATLYSAADRQTEVEYQKYILMEKYFIQLSETCQQLMSLLKEGLAVKTIVDRLSFASSNTLYRRKAACMERWTKMIKQDSNYKQLFI